MGIFFFRYFLGSLQNLTIFMGFCFTNCWFYSEFTYFWGVLQIPPDQIFLGYGADAGSEPMYEQKFGVSPLDKLFPMKVDFKSLILPRRIYS